jgi:hypothetical protein
MLIRVIAQNTVSGNPCRGWVHLDKRGNFNAFIDEGYLGSQPIQELLDAGEIESISVNITTKEYNRLKKWKANQ